MKEVPDNYLTWCIEKIEGGYVRTMATIELERRKRKKISVPDMYGEFAKTTYASKKLTGMNYVVPFGKYKDWWISDVPADYLQFMAKNLNGTNQEFKKKIGTELKRRKKKKA